MKLELPWRKILAWALSALLMAWVLSDFEFDTLAESLHSSRWELVGWAAVLNLIGLTTCRVKRFAILLNALPHPGDGVGFRELTSISLATRALNLALPARAGEALRAIQLNRRHGYAVDSVIAAVAMETILEGISLALPALILLGAGLLLGWELGAVARFLYPLVILGIFFAALALIAGSLFQSAHPLIHEGRRWRARFRTAVMRLGISFRSMHGPSIWLKALTWTILGDAIDLLMIGLCLSATGISLMPMDWFVVLAAINVAILLPTPGNIGTLEAGAVLALGAMGVARGPALAFALVYHATHLLPILVAGALSLHRDSPVGTRKGAA